MFVLLNSKQKSQILKESGFLRYMGVSIYLEMARTKQKYIDMYER